MVSFTIDAPLASLDIWSLIVYTTRLYGSEVWSILMGLACLFNRAIKTVFGSL